MTTGDNSEQAGMQGQRGQCIFTRGFQKVREHHDGSRPHRESCPDLPQPNTTTGTSTCWQIGRHLPARSAPRHDARNTQRVHYNRPPRRAAVPAHVVEGSEQLLHVRTEEAAAGLAVREGRQEAGKAAQVR